MNVDKLYGLLDTEQDSCFLHASDVILNGYLPKKDPIQFE